MKKISGILTLALLLFMFPVYTLASDYHLCPGDILNIGVWGFEDLQVKETAIRPDGMIEFPVVGEIKAGDLTPAELNHSLTSALNGYIKNPKVAVNIFKYHTTRVYVLGEVTKPGLYEIEKQHNVLDAIGIAGGYTKDAAKKKVFIIRKNQTGEPQKVNLLKLLKEGDVAQNYALNDGDTVFLSGNSRINFATDILPWVIASYDVSRLGTN